MTWFDGLVASVTERAEDLVMASSSMGKGLTKQFPDPPD